MKNLKGNKMNKLIYFFVAFVLIGTFIIGIAGSDQKAAKENYQEYCATCHGNNFQGGLGNSLVDGV